MGCNILLGEEDKVFYLGSVFDKCSKSYLFCGL